jgi:hypothetical protein
VNRIWALLLFCAMMLSGALIVVPHPGMSWVLVLTGLFGSLVVIAGGKDP